MNPSVSVIVVNYRQATLAARCVASLRRAFDGEDVAGEIVLVDCGSGEEEAAALEAVPAELVRLPDNRGYSGGVNAGMARSRAERFVLCNADVEFRDGALAKLVRSLDDPRAGACGPVCSWDASDRVLLPPGFDPGFLQELGMLRPRRSARRDDRSFANFAREAVQLWTRGGAARHLSGAVLAARRDVFDRVGRFDEGFLFEYEETEWERRVRAAGFELRVVAGARVRHLWGGSARGDPETERRRRESRALFRERHYGRVGRVLLERAGGSAGRPSRAAPPRRDRVELPAQPGAWLALSPHASRIPFAGADLALPFRVPEEIRAAAPAGDWFCTIFSGEDGRPLDTFVAELA
ncbi:MAG: glycosyltransferase [Acidobacteriota bacterium]